MGNGIAGRRKRMPAVASYIAAILPVILIAVALASCQTAEPALQYGDIYSAEAFRPMADGSIAEIRDLSVSEAKEVFEYLYQAKRKEAEGEYFNPDGVIIIKLKKTVDGKEQLHEYRLTAYEEYQTWLLEIDNNGVRKVWRLEVPDGLDSIVEGIMEEGLWNQAETQTPAPAVAASPLPSPQ